MRHLIIYIPMVVVGTVFWQYQKANKNTFGAVSWIIAVYLVMAVLAIGLDLLGHGMAAYELRIGPTVYLSGCLALGFWGLTGLTDRQVREIEIENIQIYRLLETALILSSFISIVFFLPFTRNALTGDIRFNREDLEYVQSGLSSWPFLNTFAALAANLFVFNLLFAFFNMIPGFGRGTAPKVRAILLLVGSTSYVFYILAYVGRDGIVFWAATFVLIYLLLRKFVSERWRRNVRRFAWITVGLATIPFVAITVARSSDAGVLVSVLQYGGVQVQQFNDQFIGYSEPQWGRINFPIVFRFFPFDNPYFDRVEWFKVYTDVGVRPWTFSTYVGSFVQDVGMWATPLLIGLIAMGTRSSLRGVRSSGRFSLAQIFVFILCAQIVLYGVFYFRQGLANSYLVAVVVMALLLKVSGRRRKRRVLSRRSGVAPLPWTQEGLGIKPLSA